MTAAEKFGLGPIGQIALTVQGLEKATAFYRDTLGLRFLFNAPNMSFFDCGGIRLLVGTAAGQTTEPAPIILYYKVDDIQQAFQTLTGRGVVFEQKPHPVAKLPDHELWLAFFRDGENNLAALMSEVR